MNEQMSVAEAIAALRRELASALAEGWYEHLRFELGSVELQLQVTVTRQANGKLGWQIIEFGGASEKLEVQTLKITLNPKILNQDGTPINFSISGPHANEDRFS